MPVTLSPARERLLLLTLAGIQFTHIMDFMIMMPLGPFLTQLFQISDAQFGALVSAYTLSAGASGLLASTYIDKFDRKKLLLVLYVLFALATLACGLAEGYVQLMVARVLAGVFGGVLSALSQTVVGDVIPFERRGRAMGVVMTSFSVSTVAGVPLGLYLAAHWGWHTPFLLIAGLCVVLTLVASWSLPSLSGHLGAQGASSAWARIAAVLADRNHLQAFAFSACLMFTGFTVIPYITIYMQANVGLQSTEIPLIYLVGGVATLITARQIGIWSDAWGKYQTFRLMALAVMVPLVAITLLPKVPLAVALCVTTLFFICMSGRMIPGMAMLTSAANPVSRGTFMTLNSAVQSAAMGLAALIGGHLIGRGPDGQVQHYVWAGLVGVLASFASIWVGASVELACHSRRPSLTPLKQKAFLLRCI